MNENIKIRSLAFWLTALTLSIGMALSLLSGLGICLEHCAANANYRLLGMHFAFIGTSFFGCLLLFYLLSVRWPIFTNLVNSMIAMGLGAEMMFISVQKFQIGHWCPVCLSIALMLAIAGMVQLFAFLKQFSMERGSLMINFFKKSVPSIFCLMIGFGIAFMGISKVNPLEASVMEIQDKLAFGKKDSPIVVYCVSDWFCDSCKKAEPVIAGTLPEILQKATFYFVDYPVHAKSTNYIPYNLAFLINNKIDYLQARALLMDLTHRVDAPTQEDIKAMARKGHMQFKELSYLDIKAGTEFFDEIIKKYAIDATPALVITNTKTNQTQVLKGTYEIQEDAILKAIDTLSQ